MKARIIDNMSEKPNIIKWNGKEYDLQMGMYSYAKIEETFKGGVAGVLGELGKISVINHILSILINEAIVIRNFEQGTDEKFVTPEYVGAKCKKEDYPAYTKAVGIAFGLSIGFPDEDDAEISAEFDDALGGEEFPEEKN